MTRRTLALLFGGAVLLAAAPQPAGAQFGEGEGLGGFAMSATASPVIVLFDAPSAGIPASPIMEWDMAFSHARLESGPSARAVASPIWPGETAANIGPFLSSEFNGQAHRGGAPEEFAIPTIPSWPVKAETSYPQSPHNEDRSLGGAATMRAASRETFSEAVTTTAGFGLDAVVDAGSVRSVSRAIANKNDALTEVKSVVTDLVIGDGLVTADKIVTEALITSDGETAVIEGDTKIAGLTMGGQPFEYDGEHLTMADSGDDGALTGAIEQLSEEGLSNFGIEVTLASPDDIVDGPTASRAASAMSIEFSNQAAQAIFEGMPEEMRKQISPHVGTDQTLRVVLGGVTASTAASPAFSFDLGVTDDFGGGSVSGDTGDFGSASGSVGGGTDVLGGGVGDEGTPTIPAPDPLGPHLSDVATRPAFARPVPVKGVSVGMGLLGLGGLLAGARVMRKMSDTLLSAGAKEAACPHD